MSTSKPLLETFFDMAGGLGITRHGYRMASAGSYCCTIRDIVELDLDDRSLLDSAIGPELQEGTRDRVIEVNGYDALSRDNLLFTANGGQQAIDVIVKALLEPGDEVFATVPNWPQIAGWDNTLKQNVGLPGISAKVEILSLKMEDDWAYPLEELQEKVSSKTKLIITQTPGHNPTGNNMDIKALCEIAEDAGAYLLHDEIYRGLELNAPAYSHQTAVNLYENAIAVNSLSKTLGLEGLRFGWIASRNEEVLSKIAPVLFWGRAKQHLAFKIAYHAFEPDKFMSLLDDKRRIQHDCWSIVYRWVMSHSDIFEWRPPEGAFIGFVKYDLDIDSWTFCEKLLNEFHVLVIPGICYGFDNFIRVGIGKTTPDKVEKGVEQITKGIESLA